MRLPNRKQVCVQLTNETDSDLDKMALGLGLARSQIMRMLIKGAIETYRESGTLPTWNYTQTKLIEVEG